MALLRLEATEYTIGWVCALPIELAAAQAMLDERHAEPLNVIDPDGFTFGRIGSHNVVLTSLPAGHMGIGPAAVAATRMRSQFRSIDIGLMVGIGGGVPSDTADIRLGDVVISQPYKQHGGVVQYDFGKTGRDGRVKRIGSLNRPPKELLNAVSQLRSNHYLDRIDFTTYLEAFSALPKFSLEAAGPDVLFQSTYDHDGEGSCEQCDRSRLVKRCPRAADEQVIIHYGTIASGNQVMKDGVTRDRLSTELDGVLCFEMEAAGLMNDFPCLVVRGICDYADSHKSKTWQPFAAATAAACAKEILSLVPAVQKSKEEAPEDNRKYHIPFSLKKVPVAKFADRLRDTGALERVLLPKHHRNERRIMILHGLGGMGKTQLAADFARRHKNTFSAILWLDGSSESSIRQSLAAWADQILEGRLPEDLGTQGDRQAGDVDEGIKRVIAWMNIKGNSNWLLIVDNVDRDYRMREEDPEAYDLESYLPEADHGSVLVTTRLPHLGQLGSPWELRKVDIDHARAIFETWYNKSIRGECDELLTALDGLPLALAQAAAYMNETATSPKTYIRLYKEKWSDLMNSQESRLMPLRNYANGTVATTWMISFSAIQSRNWAAANLLLLWAHLDNNSMWFELLATAPQAQPSLAEKMSIWIGAIGSEEVEFHSAIGLLRNYSFVEKLEGQSAYTVHPVVHQWALHIQDNHQRKALAWLAVVAVGLSIPYRDDIYWWETQVRMFPHAALCAKTAIGFAKRRYAQHKWDWQHEEMAWLLRTLILFGNIFMNQGNSAKAEEIYRYAIQEQETFFGPDDQETLRAVVALGNLLGSLGHLKDAEKMLQRALHGYERALGPEHRYTVDTLHSLTIIYDKIGRVDDAEAMYLHILRLQENASGPEHVSTIYAINNLGVMYMRLKRYEEAEKMFLRALQVQEKVLGPDQTSMIEIFHNLGDLYSNLDMIDQSAKMYLRALQVQQNSLGQERPGILGTVSSLGKIYLRMGKWDDAERLFQRVIQGYVKNLGMNNITAHLPTLEAMWDLGYVLAQMNNPKEARSWYLKAVLGFEKMPGKDHEICQKIRSNIAHLDLMISNLQSTDKTELGVENAGATFVANPASGSREYDPYKQHEETFEGELDVGIELG